MSTATAAHRSPQPCSKANFVTLSDSLPSAPKAHVNPPLNKGAANVVCLDSDTESDGSFAHLNAKALVSSATSCQQEVQLATVPEKNGTTGWDLQVVSSAIERYSDEHTTKWKSLQRCSIKKDLSACSLDSRSSGERNSGCLRLEFYNTEAVAVDTPCYDNSLVGLHSDSRIRNNSRDARLSGKAKAEDLTRNLSDASDDDLSIAEQIRQGPKKRQIDSESGAPDFGPSGEDELSFSTKNISETLKHNFPCSESSADSTCYKNRKRKERGRRNSGADATEVKHKKLVETDMRAVKKAEKARKLQERLNKKEEELVKRRQKLEEREQLKREKEEELVKRRHKLEEREQLKREKEQEMVKRKLEEREQLKREKEEEKERQKEERKRRIEEEKQRREELKAEAAERRKLEREKEKWERGKFALQNMTVLIDTKVVEEGLIGGYLLSRLAEKGYTYRLVSNKIKKTVVWQMKLPSKDVQREFQSLDSQGVEDSLNRLGSQLSLENLDLSYILVVLEAGQFSEMVAEGSLDKHILNVQRQYPGFTVCYLVNRLMSYLHKRNQQQYNNLESGWICPPVEQVFCK